MRLRTAACTALVALLVAPTATAHVTFNPGEWEAGGFARFAIRVPNESETGASTTKLTVQFPESVISARFLPVPGWQRTVEMAQLETPIEEEGEEPITERMASVTWSGGQIRPGEFLEFGISFQVPEDATGELLFPAVQTYSDGAARRWIDPDPEAESPAPRVNVLPAEEEGAAAETTTTTADDGAAEAAAAGGGDGDGQGRATLALILSIVGLLAALAALALAVVRPRRAV